MCTQLEKDIRSYLKENGYTDGFADYLIAHLDKYKGLTIKKLDVAVEDYNRGSTT